MMSISTSCIFLRVRHQRTRILPPSRKSQAAALRGDLFGSFFDCLYWCFQAPVGYRYERVSDHGNLLVRDEPYASVIQEALEGFASGRFQSQAEVQRFLERDPVYPEDLPDGKIRMQRVTDLLTRVLYAGYTEVEKWDMPLRKGHHEAIISFKTFEKIQQRRSEGAKAPARKDINEDFPLSARRLDWKRPSQNRASRSIPSKSCSNYRCRFSQVLGKYGTLAIIPLRESSSDWLLQSESHTPAKTDFERQKRPYHSRP
ncbi:recombinase family protein [uncultured Roseobacter sp.]|uniref:recombinase family protein n=1 Tax=uncultured Roseobacter sp. TaxID=114847 RepID=UPI002620009C|nr:recombinase family protein [uncultured Roseobacter sp.]